LRNVTYYRPPAFAKPLLKLQSFVLLGLGIFRCPGSRYGLTDRSPITDHRSPFTDHFGCGQRLLCVFRGLFYCSLLFAFCSLLFRGMFCAFLCTLFAVQLLDM
jgi:hypothetical protein